MSSYTDNVCSLLTAIQNFYLIYVQLFIFHFFKILQPFSQLFFFLSSSSSFFFWGGGGGGRRGVILINLGDKEGLPKRFLRKRGGHHILQELLVKSHQLPLNQTKNERSLMAMHCKDLK